MNFITIIIIAIVVWLVYSLIQSYRNLEKELREIRAKCIGFNTAATTATLSTSSNLDKPKTTATTSTFTNQKKKFVQPGQLTPVDKENSSNKTKNNTGTNEQTGAYTPTGDQIYSNDSDPYDNDPLSSMKKNLLYGLKSLKTYSAI